MKKMAFVIAFSLLNGCTTIHFDNGNRSAVNAESERWHHNVAFALHEASAPVDLDKVCQGKNWRSVKTEVSFLDGLITSITSPIWYPKTVAVSCDK